MTRPVVLTAVALAALLLLGSTCGERFVPQTTRVLFFNQDAAPFMVDGITLDTWMSKPWYVRHAETLHLAITRDADTLGRLVVISLLDTSDPGDYDACINLRCDGTDTLRVVEYSPELDAWIEEQ